MLDDKRLQFLESLMAAIGVSKPELAHLMRMTPQNIFAYFKRDDMRLSCAMQIVDRLGYELSFSLDRENPSSPLCVVARKDIADRLGLNYTGVNRWFFIDDMAISYIFKIAELYGLKVKTTIKPKQTGN